jgi:hypothetical protein
MLVNQPEQRTSVAIITRLAFVAACLATAEASPEHVQLKYLGTAGWEISDGRTVVLIDPYLSRLRMRIPNDDAPADDPRRLFTRDDLAESGDRESAISTRGRRPRARYHGAASAGVATSRPYTYGL